MPRRNGTAHGQDIGFALGVKRSQISQTRQPAVDLENYINNPAVPRANIAVSKESPNGTDGYAKKYEDYTVLQQHVLFWDRDGDGLITPYDTYIGFRELGFNVLFSVFAVLIINLNFSYPSKLAYSWFPDPLFRVYVPSIHNAKHGSDSGIFDHEGRFVPQKFESIFSKYDKEGDGTLTLRELFDLMHGQRGPVDPFGWCAAFFEWITTWLLVQKDGKVYKEDVRQVFDGSIFWRIRDSRMKKEGWRQGFGFLGDNFIGPTKVA